MLWRCGDNPFLCAAAYGSYAAVVILIWPDPQKIVQNYYFFLT